MTRKFVLMNIDYKLYWHEIHSEKELKERIEMHKDQAKTFLVVEAEDHQITEEKCNNV